MLNQVGLIYILWKSRRPVKSTSKLIVLGSTLSETYLAISATVAGIIILGTIIVSVVLQRQPHTYPEDSYAVRALIHRWS